MFSITFAKEITRGWLCHSVQSKPKTVGKNILHLEAASSQTHTHTLHVGCTGIFTAGFICLHTLAPSLGQFRLSLFHPINSGSVAVCFACICMCVKNKNTCNKFLCIFSAGLFIFFSFYSFCFLFFSCFFFAFVLLVYVVVGFPCTLCHQLPALMIT